MQKNLPDKWIRKTLFEALNNMEVDGQAIPVYDYRAQSTSSAYILITTQSNLVDAGTRCGERWQNSTTIEVFVKYLGTGNPGSRLLADNILDEARNRTQSLELDPLSGLTILHQTENIPNDLVTVTQDNNIFRKFMRYELLIN